MKGSTYLYYALGICAAAVMFVGCASQQTSSGAGGIVPQNVRSVAQATSPLALLTRGDGRNAAPPDRGRSWMAPNAKAKQLLYVPDFFSGDVNVYSYPGGTLVGTLTGFNGPQGACVDGAQNIWITNEYAADIVEYAHGGTAPIATLTDPGAMPLDCSVDPTTGNVAVTNWASTQPPNQGAVAIYAGASGNPVIYADGRLMYAVYFCSYDDHGNLFVDGTQYPYYWPAGAFQYAEIPKGSSSFTNITLKPTQKIAWPEGIHWDGRYVGVGNLLKGEIYQTSGAQIVHTVSLKGSRGAIDFFPGGNEVIVGLDSAVGKVGVWDYPTGGAAVKMFTLPGRNDPVAGAVISK